MSTQVMPGAEPFAFDGGPAGFLLLHGFSGSPGSLRRIGEWLAARGHAVVCPRLPGHGTRWRNLGRTRWQDWANEAIRALKDLDAKVETVVAFGLSFGGALALHLAVRYPDAVDGVILVNPWLKERPLAALSPVLKYVVPSVKGVINDIKKPGQDEVGYERIPLKAFSDAVAFHKIVKRELPRVRRPLLLFQSNEDHAIPTGSSALILERVGSEQKDQVSLENSYHVATLDHDAELIFERTHEFAETLAARG
ncbi:MAG TPA: alpha/beta fold hydrolase [Actinomycetota bacterium]|nr:alpha/beta fold hydrolase [Actinomycetota bacterium]